MNPGSRKAFLVILSILLPACQQGRDATDPGKASYVSIANDRYGKNVEYIPNVDSSFILCVNRQESAGQPVVTLRFFVYDAVGHKVLFEDSLEQAAVFWMNSSQLRVVSTPEVSSGDEAPGGGYIYDARAREKKK
ncbi:MAG: hypothetical protein OEM41_06445 [Ignavibacteria bacterium]|nr:hypothetical protein [Ignavibacteria bacterium]